MFEHDLNFFLTYERMLQSKKKYWPKLYRGQNNFQKEKFDFSQFMIMLSIKLYTQSRKQIQENQRDCF